MLTPLALWAHPRARSTVFGRMMYERGDFSVKDEPFARCYYFSDDRVHRRRADVEPSAAHRFEAVTERVFHEARLRPLFIKDHAYHVLPRADATFLGGFKNTFLIRHPAQSLPSLYARMPDFTLEETGYEALYRLFERVRELDGNTPVIIDADDLVDRPHETVRAYCEGVGIPFLAGTIKWKVGLPAGLDANWWGDSSWHTHLENSNGFVRQASPGYVTVDNNEHIREAYQYCLPFYSQLHEHRLRVS